MLLNALHRQGFPQAGTIASVSAVQAAKIVVEAFHNKKDALSASPIGAMFFQLAKQILHGSNSAARRVVAEEFAFGSHNKGVQLRQQVLATPTLHLHSSVCLVIAHKELREAILEVAPRYIPQSRSVQDLAQDLSNMHLHGHKFSSRSANAAVTLSHLIAHGDMSAMQRLCSVAIEGDGAQFAVQASRR